MMMVNPRRKIRRVREKPDVFDGLPDDLVLSILGKLSASAASPADLISVTSTCKRLSLLGENPTVLAQVGPKTVSVKAKSWCPSAHRFLTRCAAAGSPEANYTLGMIRFYCSLGGCTNGLSLMARAAIKAHAPALYSIAVIQFNGSGSAARNLPAGVALAQRAALLGHGHAIRELGHCLQDGFGIRRNVVEGRKLLIQANAREITSVLRAASPEMRNFFLTTYLRSASFAPTEFAFQGDLGGGLSPPEVHPVNVFLKEWFESGRGVLKEGTRMCSHDGCGRPETRQNEFRRCSLCAKVNYCSRGCQALDWKLRHKTECVATGRLVANAAGGGQLAGAMMEV